MKRVENFAEGKRKSLPKWQREAERVEKSITGGRKTLPKRREKAEKVENLITGKVKGRPPPQPLTILKIIYQQNRRSFQRYFFQKYHLPPNP